MTLQRIKANCLCMLLKNTQIKKLYQVTFTDHDKMCILYLSRESTQFSSGSPFFLEI